jgi:hypothetical protein
MWYPEFADRLEAWTELRQSVAQLPLDECLQKINDWWFHSPWKSYYLHWDDLPTWPDPWQLLSDNTYCELARGLGILYTISMIEHKDLTSAELVLTDEGYNLVSVNKEKYILNWTPESIVNTDLIGKIKRRFTAEQVNQQYK